MWKYDIIIAWTKIKYYVYNKSEKTIYRASLALLPVIIQMQFKVKSTGCIMIINIQNILFLPQLKTHEIGTFFSVNE